MPRSAGRDFTASHSRGCIPPWTAASDEVGQGVRLAVWDLVEGAPRHRAVTAKPAPEREQ